jgi:small subunit ribosomal protein S2
MIPIEDLLEAGVHFGHRVNKWNPKMAPYIFGERNGVHIIDLIQTLGYLEEAYAFLTKYQSPRRGSAPGATKTSSGALGNKVLFVGTKKQVSSIIQKQAENCNAHYVNHRWLGGLLTNWKTMKLCVNKLNTLKSEHFGSIGSSESGTTTKKERAVLKKQYDKLTKFYGGIQNMSEIPEIVIIVGQDVEQNAVEECQKLAMTRSSTTGNPGAKTSSVLSALPRTITILDTNCDPSKADLFIPANDDSTKSVELILSKLAEAILASQG